MLVTFGRDSTGQWYEVTTDANGFDDDVYLTTLAQVLTSDTDESPFYPEYGIPARDSVINRTHPDYFVDRTRAQFSPYFANISVINQVDEQTNEPVYYVDVLKQDGATQSITIYV